MSAKIMIVYYIREHWIAEVYETLMLILAWIKYKSKYALREFEQAQSWIHIRNKLHSACILARPKH